MFVKSCTELPVAFDAVRAALLRPPQSWLDGAAAEAGRHADALLLDVGLEVRGHELTRCARLEVGEPVASDRVVSLPIRLRVERDPGLFPSFEGTLDAAWLGAGRTHLALAAQYDPPFGAVGRIADRALLHRVAEVIAQRLLETVAHGLASGDHRAALSGAGSLANEAAPGRARWPWPAPPGIAAGSE
jgi:hypothetical protein